MAVDQEMINAYNQALSGDESGFCEIYTKTYSYVYSHCRMIMKNDDDAMDLLQETYLAAFQSLGTLANINSIYSWLGQIAYRQGMKIFRKRKDVLLDDEAQGLFEVKENTDMSAVPGHDLEMQETADLIKGIIDELPESQRAVVLAYYYDGMSVGQIAELMETSSGTIKSRLNYARKHIEERVSAKEKQMGIRLHSAFAAIMAMTIRGAVSGLPMSAESAGAGYAVVSAKAGLNAASGGIYAAGQAQMAGGMNPAGQAQMAGGVNPAGQAQMAGGMNPAGQAQMAGGMNPAGQAQMAGGMNPTGQAQMAGGVNPAGQAQMAGGMNPAGQAQMAGGVNPGKYAASGMGVSGKAGAAAGSAAAAGGSAAATKIIVAVVLVICLLIGGGTTAYIISQNKEEDSVKPATTTEVIADSEQGEEDKTDESSEADTEEDAAEEENAAEDTAETTELTKAKIRNIYMKYVWEAYHFNWPDGTELFHNDEASTFDESDEYSENKFAVLDVNGDGEDELVIFYTSSAMANMRGGVYHYNQETGSIDTLFNGGPYCQFYPNGIMEVNISHDGAGGGGDIWPHELYKYNQDTGMYDDIGYVDDFVDDNGATYLYPGSDESTNDAASYQKWHDEFYGADAAEIEPDWLQITRENIRKFSSEFFDQVEKAVQADTPGVYDAGISYIRTIISNESAYDMEGELLANVPGLTKDPDEGDDMTRYSLNGKQLLIVDNLDAGCINYKDEAIDNFVIFGLYPGMDEASAIDKMERYGFTRQESEGAIEYISADNADNASVGIYIEGGKVQKISVDFVRNYAG